jgi:hypothetical protein
MCDECLLVEKLNQTWPDQVMNPLDEPAPTHWYTMDKMQVFF